MNGSVVTYFFDNSVKLSLALHLHQVRWKCTFRNARFGRPEFDGGENFPAGAGGLRGARRGAPRRGLLDWASLPLIMPALVIGKRGENRRGQLQIEGEHPRAVACGNAISVGKSPLPAVKISPLARVACGTHRPERHTIICQKEGGFGLFSVS